MFGFNFERTTFQNEVSMKETRSTLANRRPKLLDVTPKNNRSIEDLDAPITSALNSDQKRQVAQTIEDLDAPIAFTR